MRSEKIMKETYITGGLWWRLRHRNVAEEMVIKSPKKCSECGRPFQPRGCVYIEGSGFVRIRRLIQCPLCGNIEKITS